MSDSNFGFILGSIPLTANARASTAASGDASCASASTETT